MTLRHSAKWVALAAIALLAAGCPKAPAADPIEPGPQITSFTSSAAKVARGTVVTLSWETAHATSVKLESLKGGAVDGATDPSGSVDVQIDSDTLFVLTAVNGRGASERVALSVLVDSAAHDLLLYALPSEITSGESVTLTWSAPDASQVSIVGTPGGAVDLKGQLGSGSVTLTPSVSTSYVLNADGQTATAKVTVKPKILSLTANPASAQRNQNLTVSWETAGAATVSLVAPGRGELVHETDPAKVASGSYSEAIPAQVDPGAVYGYKLVATDATGATTEQTLTVYVEGVPAVKTFTGPLLARRGQTFTLAWTTAQADSVTLSADGAMFYQAPATKISSGSVTIPSPAAKTTYTLTAASSRGGSASKTLEVDSVGAPTVSNFTANPTSVSAGTPVTLSWSFDSARFFQIREATDGIVYSAMESSGSATAQVYPNHDSTYTLIGDNGFGETATAQVQVTVSNPLTLTASLPGAIISGTSVDLSWTGGNQIVGLPHSIIDVRSASTGFDDIATTGTALSFPNSSDDDKASISAPNFHTTLFGKAFPGEVQVSTNGYLTFGKWLNAHNYTSAALPTSKLEPYSLAPYWGDHMLGSGGVLWQVKGTASDPVLIVQWNNVESASIPMVFQAKVHSTGQVDFEYKTLPSGTSGTVGIQGPTPSWGLAPTGTTIASGLGLTFFGPKSSPVTVTPVVPATFVGGISMGGGTLRVAYDFKNVLSTNDLVVTEAMSRPDPTVGSTGKWIELANRTNSTVDLSGWSVGLGDGGTLPLSGSIPAQGQLVVGSTTDPAQNGDAGVQLAVSGFDLASNDSVSLRRSGTLNTYSFTSPAVGTASVQDPGPFRWSTDSSSGATAVPRAQTCAATATYSSSPVQRGTPGQLKGCGFGYFLSQIDEAFFDISSTGTPLVTTFPAVVPLDVSQAPFPFFGTNRNTLYVSTRGLITTDSTLGSSSYPTSAIPSTSYNGMMAVFAYVITGSTAANTQIYSRRVLANEDPAAAAPHWIVQWSHFYDATGDDMNFQAKLFDDGTIEYHFAEMRSNSSSVYGAGPFMTTWLQNYSGQALVINARSLTPGIGWHSAFRFSPR